jgi:signal transduction histidine kinase
LRCLAHLAAGEFEAAPRARDFLDGLAAELGAAGLAWLPAAGRAVGSRSFRPREIDWGLARSLAPGETLELGPAVRGRRSRLAARADWEVLVAAPGGVHPPGVLRANAPAPLPLTVDQLATLVRLVAAVLARCDPEVAARAHRERRLARRAAGLTHDLRNQLTLALLQLERLRDGADERDTAGLARTLTDARALCAQGLVGEGTTDAPRELNAIGLRALLREEARAAGQLARRGAREVDVQCPATTRVFGEREQLRRVLRNLLTNALEATATDGRVTVRVRPLPTGDTEVTVADQGRGMDAEELTRMLAPGTSASGGTGYGTAGLFDALTELDAEVVFDSAPDAGTRARVRLASAPSRGAAPVLLVDPDDRRRARRARDLRAWNLDRGRGREVVAVRGPRQALRVGSSIELAAVVLARGVAGPELARLRERCRAGGVAWHVVAAGDSAPPERSAARARRSE